MHNLAIISIMLQDGRPFRWSFPALFRRKIPKRYEQRRFDFDFKGQSWMNNDGGLRDLVTFFGFSRAADAIRRWAR